MQRSAAIKAAITGMLFAVTVAVPALAHHGWSWAEEEFSELTGTVRSVFVGNPHARIELEVDGEVWTVELAPPAATERAGFTEEAVSSGDEATVVGHRSRDANERVFKAVRVIVGDESYDVYPRRLPPA
ncbi:MAG: DUF6152 family protein [Aliihoeflea sp.]